MTAEIGTAIVSYIEPTPGHERAFNEWYERDHFPAAVLAGPVVFAGARFVADAACRTLRPAGATLFGDPARGRHLAVAWVLPGRQAEWEAWVAAEMETLVAEGRMFPHREHLHTGVYRFVRATGPVPAPQALAHGFGGVVALASPIEVPMPPPGPCTVVLEAERTIISSADPPGHELVLAFTEFEPFPAFAAVADAVVTHCDIDGPGFASPFLATVPGTDVHIEGDRP